MAVLMFMGLRIQYTRAVLDKMVRSTAWGLQNCFLSCMYKDI